MVADITYRRAEERDITLLAAHHRQMFEEMRSISGLSLQKTCCGPNCSPSSAGFPERPPMDFARLEEAQQQKLAGQLPEKTCLAWIAEQNGEPVGSGGLSILQTVPVPEDPSAEVGFIHSVYILPSMRRHGIASILVDHLLADAKRRGLGRVQLAASEAGRSLYEKKGFMPLEQMILWL